MLRMLPCIGYGYIISGQRHETIVNDKLDVDDWNPSREHRRPPMRAIVEGFIPEENYFTTS
jgi:hypothetical protein